MKQFSLALSLFFFCSFSAQEIGPVWNLEYNAPYFTNFGLNIGYEMNLKNLTTNEADIDTKSNSLRFRNQLGYFYHTNVTHNFLAQTEGVLQHHFSKKKHFIALGLGLAYWLSAKRQTGVLSLATGEIEYKTENHHALVPLVNLSIGAFPQKRLGYFLKMTYGRKFDFENSSTAFIGASVGLSLKINKSTNNE